jgi:hypothetical protein
MTNGLIDDDPLAYHLNQAQEHAQRALDLVYRPGEHKRGLLYRLKLGRAQSALMTLLVRELGKDGEP